MQSYITGEKIIRQMMDFPLQNPEVTLVILSLGAVDSDGDRIRRYRKRLPGIPGIR